MTRWNSLFDGSAASSTQTARAPDEAVAGPESGREHVEIVRQLVCEDASRRAQAPADECSRDERCGESRKEPDRGAEEDGGDDAEDETTDDRVEHNRAHGGFDVGEAMSSSSRFMKANRPSDGDFSSGASMRSTSACRCFALSSSGRVTNWPIRRVSAWSGR